MDIIEYKIIKDNNRFGNYSLVTYFNNIETLRHINLSYKNANIMLNKRLENLKKKKN